MDMLFFSIAKMSPYIVGGYRVPDIKIDECTFLNMSEDTNPGSSKSNLVFLLAYCPPQMSQIAQMFLETASDYSGE